MGRGSGEEGKEIKELRKRMEWERGRKRGRRQMEEIEKAGGYMPHEKRTCINS
jgi:hypothetical protein